ncbi:hypothetical protein PoB_007481600 [Plakobranchus ocellatus]|uniref:Uncharacterized protein n=1 Tax=Plakobranchus ocellatus TaxID=259542 RepID=A0AAV4DWN3_9GAST|nr:hypothetical protein PoB_007481600 [Plakobranchus ocellatus]
MGISPTNTFDMINLATSNTYSNMAHWERDERSDIESQVPRTYSTRRLQAVKGQDDGVALNFVLNLTRLDAPSVSVATQFLHHLLLRATP